MRLGPAEYRLSACAGKNRYRRRGQADEVRRDINRRHGTVGEIEVYRCGACGQFHLAPTNRKQKIRAARRERPRVKTIRWDGDDDESSDDIDRALPAIAVRRSNARSH